MVGEGRWLEGLEDSMARKRWGRVERFGHSRRRGNMQDLGRGQRFMRVYGRSGPNPRHDVSGIKDRAWSSPPPLPLATLHVSLLLQLRHYTDTSIPPSLSLSLSQQTPPPLLSSLSQPPLQQISPDACRDSHQKKKSPSEHTIVSP